jgi:hypothetical protein
MNRYYEEKRLAASGTVHLLDDIDCYDWLCEVGLEQYEETFLTNFTKGAAGPLSRKRLAQVRLQDFPHMNITQYDHQKVLMDHIRQVALTVKF